MDVTVLTPGGRGWGGFWVALLHLALWISGAAMTVVALNAFDANERANSNSKVMCYVNIAAVGFTLVVVAVHASFVEKDDSRWTSLVNVFLLAPAALSCALASSLTGYALVLGDQDAFTYSVSAQMLIILAACCVAAFYVEFSHRGTMRRGESLFGRSNRVSPEPMAPQA